MLPDGAPAWMADRSQLWNAVELGEKRKDSQVAREVEFAIPQELSQEEGIALARDFVQREFVSRGMVADLNVHWERGQPARPRDADHARGERAGLRAAR